MEPDRIGKLRLLVPEDIAERLRSLPNVHVADPEKAGTSPELSWDNVKRVATVVTIISGMAALPGHIAEIAKLITDQTLERGGSSTCVIQGATDNHSISVKDESDLRALEELLSQGIVWQNTGGPERPNGS